MFLGELKAEVTEELHRPIGKLQASKSINRELLDVKARPLSTLEIKKLDDFQSRARRIPSTTAHIRIEETVEPITMEHMSNDIKFYSNRFQDYISGKVLSDMCDALDKVFAGIADTKDDIHFSIGQAPKKDFAPECEVVDSSLAEATKDASGFFSDKKLYRWKAGLSGYILFTNSLFPGQHGNEIESYRLINLLSMAITNDPGQHSYYPSQQVMIKEAGRTCSCDNSLSKLEISERIANPSLNMCTERDSNDRLCVGTKISWEASFRDRWYFNQIALNSLPISNNSFKNSDLRLYKSDYDPDVYVHQWCQIDQYFPCTDIEIQVLGSKGSLPFSDFLAHSLGNWELSHRYTNDSNISHIDLKNQGDWRSLIKNANREIEKFSRNDFGFLAIPATIAFDSEVNLEGLLPASIKNNNKAAAEDIKNGDYFLLHEFTITVSNFALQEKPVKDYLKYIYAKKRARKPSSCWNKNIECMANFAREKRLRNYWYRPIQ